MSLTGKSSKSITKKDLTSDRIPIVGIKKIMFAHKATAGDTTIDMLNLTTPSEATTNGFVQPNISDLAAANLQVFPRNLTLISSSGGTLLPYVAYRISGNTIKLTQAALANEIFVGVIDPVFKSDSLVADTDFISSTGTLSAGLTDINVGKSFKVNFNPNQQIGIVMLILDGQVMLRNVGNATASPSADGDYQEVPDTSLASSSLLRVNNVNPSQDRAYIVISTALSTIRPEGSIVDEVERLQGLIDGMIPTLADLAGVGQSVFQVAPTNQQLKQFGDRVVAMERYRVLATNTTLTAQPAQLIAADTSGGAINITLPASPTNGDRIMLMDAKRTFGSSNLSILRNGNSIAGIADDLVLDITGSWAELVFISSYGWSVRQ